jgi:hypothetical protein
LPPIAQSPALTSSMTTHVGSRMPSPSTSIIAKRTRSKEIYQVSANTSTGCYLTSCDCFHKPPTLCQTIDPSSSEVLDSRNGVLSCGVSAIMNGRRSVDQTVFVTWPGGEPHCGLSNRVADVLDQRQEKQANDSILLH